MPIFKLEMSREVSRVVELRQTTTVYVKAASLPLAKEVAVRLKEELDDASWQDDDGSRVSSNDRIASSPRAESVCRVDDGPHKMQGSNLRNLETISACEFLGLTGESDSDPGNPRCFDVAPGKAASDRPIA